MSEAPSQARARAEPLIDRLQSWIAAFTSALLHLLFILLAMLAAPVTVSPPQGTAGGSRMLVDFVGATPPQPTQAPPSKAVTTPRPPAKPRAAPRLRVKPVPKATDPIPPDAVPDDVWQAQAAPASAPPPPTPQRRSPTWGQPPGMLRETHADQDTGLAQSPDADNGRRHDTARSDTVLEVGGYQVLYDMRSEAQLLAWRDQGMKEISIPLPGTRRYMVCPLETAIRRGSGPCRMVDPDSPELKTIGDARQGINMQQVYRQGEPVWRGPGPYR